MWKKKRITSAPCLLTNVETNVFRLCFTHLTQAVAGEVDAPQNVISPQCLWQSSSGASAHLVPSEVEVTKGAVSQQGLTQRLASLVSDTVETQIQRQESGVVGQGVSDGFGPVVSDVVVAHVQLLQAAPAEQFGDSSGSFVTDEVVRKVQLPQWRVVQEMLHQQSTLFIINVALMESENLQKTTGMKKCFKFWFILFSRSPKTFRSQSETVSVFGWFKFNPEGSH